MQPTNSSQRIIAFDVRPQRFGYVVVENGNLVDWGLRHAGDSDVLRSRFIDILKLWEPGTVVFKNRKIFFGNAQLQRLLSDLRNEVVRQGSVLRLVDSKTISLFFKHQGKKNKYDVATAVAQRFPELVWRLPKKRRCWEPEPARMSMYDAAAVAYVYLWLATSEQPQPQATT